MPIIAEIEEINEVLIEVWRKIDGKPSREYLEAKRGRDQDIVELTALWEPR